MSVFKRICLSPRGLFFATSSLAAPAPDIPAPHVAQASRPPNQKDPDAPTPEPTQRLLPVIDTDRCIGCERCVAVCEHSCLEMEWSFSKLTQPHQCTGEGLCVEACPEQIIRMEWVTLDAESEATERSPLTRISHSA